MISFVSRIDWTFVGLLLIILSAPFEQSEPLFELSGQVLTNVEAFVALALVVWILTCLISRRWPAWQTPLTVPALVLIGFLLLSTALISADRGVSVRFSGRFVLGFTVFLLTMNSAHSWRRVLWAVRAMALSGLIVAMLAILEYFSVASIPSWLREFRGVTAWIGGFVRPSSTLQYPTIASMYLEIVFGWGMCMLLCTGRRRGWTTQFMRVALLTVVGTGVLVTLTRAGFLTLFFVLALVVAGSWWRGGLALSFRVILLTLTLGIAAALVAGTGPVGGRFVSPTEQNWYSVDYVVPEALELAPGDLVEVEVSLVNSGSVTWGFRDAYPIRLSYHWLDAVTEEVVVFEGLRTDLVAPVGPGERVVMAARVQAPGQPGEYRLAWDMLQEELFWFSMQGVPMSFTRVSVQGKGTEQEATQLSPSQIELPQPRFRLPRQDLWRAALKLFRSSPLLGVGPDNFRFLYRDALGLEVSDETYHTHNIFLEFFVGCGLAGGFVFLYLILCLLMACAAALLNSSPEKGPFALASAAAIAAIVLHGMVDSFFQFTPTYLMIWITFGLAIRIAELSTHSHQDDDLCGKFEK